MKTENLTREALTKYAAENREAFEALLKDFVEIPSVSVDPTKKDDIRRLAQKAAGRTRQARTSRRASGRGPIQAARGGERRS